MLTGVSLYIITKPNNLNIWQSSNIFHRIYYFPTVCLFVCLFDYVFRYFQQYISYIVEFSFIGGGNRRTRRKPSTVASH